MAFWFAAMPGRREQALRKGTHRAEQAERAGWLQGPELAGDITVAIIATNTNRGRITSQAGVTTNPAAQEGRSCDHHQQVRSMTAGTVSASGPCSPRAWTELGLSAHAISMCRMNKPSLYTQERTAGKASNLSKALWLVSGTAKNQAQQSRPASPRVCLGSEIPAS